MLVFGHGKEIPTCGSRGFSTVVGHVTISSVPVTSFWMLNEPPCLSSQFHLLALPGVVGLMRRWQSCSSPSLELLWPGAFVR